MVKIAEGRGGAAVLVSDGGERELRAFLKRHGIRPSSAGFRYTLPHPMSTIAHYALRGDEALKVRKLKLPIITWGRLGQLLVLLVPFKRPTYGRMVTA